MPGRVWTDRRPASHPPTAGRPRWRPIARRPRRPPRPPTPARSAPPRHPAAGALRSRCHRPPRSGARRRRPAGDGPPGDSAVGQPEPGPAHGRRPGPGRQAARAPGGRRRRAAGSPRCRPSPVSGSLRCQPASSPPVRRRRVSRLRSRSSLGGVVVGGIQFVADVRSHRGQADGDQLFAIGQPRQGDVGRQVEFGLHSRCRWGVPSTRDRDLRGWPTMSLCYHTGCAHRRASHAVAGGIERGATEKDELERNRLNLAALDCTAGPFRAIVDTTPSTGRH